LRWRNQAERAGIATQRIHERSVRRHRHAIREAEIQAGLFDR
jgi:hypothetical protein